MPDVSDDPVARATYQYRSRWDPRTALRQRMRELTQNKVRYGYRTMTVLLNREGWGVGKKLIYRNTANQAIIHSITIKEIGCHR